MSMSPRQVGESSLWEMNAAIAGFKQANGQEMDVSLTDAEIDDLGSWLDSK